MRKINDTNYDTSQSGSPQLSVKQSPVCTVMLDAKLGKEWTIHTTKWVFLIFTPKTYLFVKA